MWLHASHNQRLANKYLDDGFIAHQMRRYLLTIALYFVAILLSLWHGILGCCFASGLASRTCFLRAPRCLTLRVKVLGRGLILSEESSCKIILVINFTGG